MIYLLFIGIVDSVGTVDEEMLKTNLVTAQKRIEHLTEVCCCLFYYYY